jgi:hypothetical protein
MRKSGSQALLQLDALKELLEDEQPGKGCQLLIFEPKERNFMEFGQNLCFTGFHLRWPPGSGRLFSKIFV